MQNLSSSTNKGWDTSLRIQAFGMVVALGWIVYIYFHIYIYT